MKRRVVSLYKIEGVMNLLFEPLLIILIIGILVSAMMFITGKGFRERPCPNCGIEMTEDADGAYRCREGCGNSTFSKELEY